MHKVLALLLLTSWAPRGDEDPALIQWFQSLMQPEYPTMSCCGNADAYYADDYEVLGDHVVATITDSRGHELPVGTKVIVPLKKVNVDPNITGHTIIFLVVSNGSPYVFCFIPGAGV